jgi:Rne/Rng family ribonuclease
MLKEIIVNEDEYESRAALLENKVLSELFIERKGERYILGNIYKGKVTSVLPGMQAAFVDIGLARNAFLHVSDIAHHLEEYDEFEISNDTSDSEETKASRKVNSHLSGTYLKKVRKYLYKLIKNLWIPKVPELLHISRFPDAIWFTCQQ